MGVQIRIDGGYQIEKELFFWYTYTHTGLINLSSELGEAMRYNEPEIIIIDYPGEYDVKWRFIKAVLGKNNKLNYLIQWKNKKFWKKLQRKKNQEIQYQQHWWGYIENAGIYKKGNNKTHAWNKKWKYPFQYWFWKDYWKWKVWGSWETDKI